MKLTTQRMLGLQTSCLRAFVVIFGLMASTVVSAQETKPAADSKMPDISGKWTYNPPNLPPEDLNGASVAPPQMYVVNRSRQAGIDFEFLGTLQPTAAPSRLKWVPGTRRFQIVPKDENAKGQSTLELSADGNTLSMQPAIDPAEKQQLAEQLKKRGVREEAVERSFIQEWRRAGLGPAAVAAPPLPAAEAKIPDIIGTWSRAESGTFSKLTIWPVENREFLFFVEGADGNGLLEWRPETLKFQGFFTFKLLGDWTVQASLVVHGPKETRRLIFSPFDGQRKQLLRSDFAKTERELDQKLSSDLTRVEAPAQPIPMTTVAVVKTEFKPSIIRDALRAKYREPPYRFYSNDTVRSVIVLAPAEAQEDIEVLIHKLDIKEESDDEAASSNIAQVAPANQPLPTSATDEPKPELLLQREFQVQRGNSPTEIKREGRQLVWVMTDVDCDVAPDVKPGDVVDLFLTNVEEVVVLDSDQTYEPSRSLAMDSVLVEHVRHPVTNEDRSGIQLGILVTPAQVARVRSKTNADEGETKNTTHVIRLKHHRAKSVAELLALEFTSCKFVADSEQNTVAVRRQWHGRDPLGELLRVESAIQKLDVPSKGAVSETTVFRAVPNTPAAKQLVEQLEAQESAAAAEAATIRQLQAKGQAEQNQQPIAEHQRKLKNLLSTAFDLKLQLEELQVKELQSRLSRLERQIGQRKELREKIIARRAGELIEGDALTWSPNGSTVVREAETGAPKFGESKSRMLPASEPTLAASATANQGAGQIVIDLYGGSQVLPGLSENPSYSKLLQSLNALKGVTTNFREIQAGDATTIVMAIVHDPSQRCQREARQAQKESELRIAINSALKAAGIEATRWDENSDAEDKSANEPAASKAE